MELEDWLKIGSVVTSRTEGNRSALMILTLNVWTLNQGSKLGKNARSQLAPRYFFLGANTYF